MLDHILCLDLHLDSLSATIFDCNFKAVHCENVQFNQVQQNNSSSINTVHEIISSLDLILQRLQASKPGLLCRVKAIATTTIVDFPVFLTSLASTMLSNLSPNSQLAAQLPCQDFFAVTERLDDADLTGQMQAYSGLSSRTDTSPREAREAMKIIQRQIAHLTGTPPTIHTFASQVYKVARSPNWNNCTHILPVGTFLDSLLAGQISSCNPVQASFTGLFNVVASQWDSKMAHACSKGRAEKLTSMLPNISSIQQTIRIAPWLAKRFSFSSDCLIVSSLPSEIAAYTSFLPGPQEGGLQFGLTDSVIIPMQTYKTGTSHALYPNPLHLLNKQDKSQRPWLAVVRYPRAGYARTQVCDSYTKTWKAFNQLVRAVCPGGSVGMDNKLFTIFVPLGPERGLRRFENGTRVSEFFDLRANPRCIIETQALDIRKKTSELNEVEYEVEDAVSLWYSWGRAAGNEQMAEIYSHVLGAPILADQAEVMACAEEVNGSTTNSSVASRASSGVFFIAAYLLERLEKPEATISIAASIEALKREDSSSPVRWKRLLACVEENEMDEAYYFSQQDNKTRALESFGDESSLQRRRSVSVTVHRDRLSVHPSSQRERSSSVASSSILSLFPLPYRADSSLIGSALSSPQGPPSYSHQLMTSPCFTSPAEYVEESVTPFQRQCSDVIRSAVQLAEPDEDMWGFYEALLEEYIRLSEMVEEQIFHNYFNSI